MLSLQCRSAFTACFLSQQNQKFLFRGCKRSPQCCSHDLQLLQSHNVGFQDSPLPRPATLGHPLQHLQTWCTVLCYKLHVLHYSVTGNLSPKLKLLIEEYIITCHSLSKQKARGKTSSQGRLVTLEREVRTMSSSRCCKCWRCCDPRHLMHCYAGWEVDETPQAQANRQLFHTSRGEVGFMSRDGAAKNKLPSMGYCKTQIRFAEQPLDCNYRSFNIPPFIAV